MSAEPLDYADFIQLVLEALEAAGIAYLVGDAVAAWAWGEPRATQDLDLVVDIPTESLPKLSAELKERDMLVPADTILDAILEARSDIPLTPFTSTAASRLISIQYARMMNYASPRFGGGNWSILATRSERFISTPPRISLSINSGITAYASKACTCATSLRWL